MMALCIRLTEEPVREALSSPPRSPVGLQESHKTHTWLTSYRCYITLDDMGFVGHHGRVDIYNTWR